MKPATAVLLAIVAVELLGVVVLSGMRTTADTTAIPMPVPDFSRLDSLTRSEMENSLKAVQNGQPGALQLLADRCMALGYFSEAELYGRILVADAPQSFEAALHHGICLDRLGQNAAAIAEYLRAAELAVPGQRPSGEVCLYHAGRCCLRDGNMAEAERLFRATGNFPLGRFHLAKLLIRASRLSEARSVLDPLLKEYPGELKLLQLKSAIVRQEPHDDAEPASLLEQYEWATDRFFPDSTIEFLGILRTRFGLTRERNRCLQLAASGQIPAAMDGLQKTLDAEWDLQTATALVDLHLQQRNPSGAAELLTEIHARAGQLPHTVERLGDVALLNGNGQEAAAHWTHASQLRPTASVFYKLAGLAERAGDAAEAARCQALGLRETGIQAFRNSDLAGAVSALTQAAAQLPDDLRTRNYLAMVRQAATVREMK